MIVTETTIDKNVGTDNEKAILIKPNSLPFHAIFNNLLKQSFTHFFFSFCEFV
jgi:hypothetical protein